MTNIEKFWKAVLTLKSSAELIVDGDITSESDFNNIKWVTGVNNGQAIFSDTCPHSEITYAKIVEEMDKLWVT